MYRRMEKAEKENVSLRAAAGYSVGEQPVIVAYNWPIDIDVACRVTSMQKFTSSVIMDYNSEMRSATISTSR